MKHDFTWKSIKCDTWGQMLHLEQLAKEQGIKPPNDKFWFTEESFNDIYCYFVVIGDKGYANDRIGDDRKHLPIVPYTEFINTLPTETIEVTECGDCPFHQNVSSGDYCGYPKREIEVDDIFSICPLKETSITIKLKTK